MITYLLSDFWLKLLAVCLAFGLWFSIASEPIVERGLQVPISFQNVPETVELAGELPETVQARIRGALSVVGALLPGDVVVVIDVSEERARSLRLFDILSVARIQAPFGVEVIKVTPSTISVTLEHRELSRMEVPVSPISEGRSNTGGMLHVVGECL